MLDEPFHELLEALKVSRNITSRHVGIVLCDPSYIMRRVQVQDIMDYDSLSEGDMKDLVELLMQVIDLGNHGQLLCSALQFKSWYECYMMSLRSST